MKLNLGCGKDIKKGYVNMDLREFPGVDVIHNLDDYPYPFEDNSFDEIYASHVVEHVKDFEKVIREMCRITKPHGKLKIKTPYFTSPGAHRVDHKHTFFHTETFNHPWKYTDIKIKVRKCRIMFRSTPIFMKCSKSCIINWLINKMQRTYLRAFSYILPSAEIHYLIEVLE